MLFKLKKEPQKVWTIPNKNGVIDNNLYNLLTTKDYVQNKYTALLGAENGGYIDYIDIEKAPHLLISGTTGSGKSVCINTMILSLLLKNSPNTLQLYIIDPKKVDYIAFRDLPHVCDYVSEPDEMHKLLLKIETIMYNRFTVMQSEKVDHINKVKSGNYPHILVIFDEMGSIANSYGKKNIFPTMENIARLSRAAGITLLLGVQRPDRQIISGQLKSNIPTRISFRLPSKTDSRIILDRNGAETLTRPGNGILINANGDTGTFQGYLTPEKQKNYILDYWNRQK